MTTPWLTVVTVVKDDEPGLRLTMDSLRSQDLDGVDVLVIDSSADRSYAPELAHGVARVLWTEPAGIYPAMNIGLAEAVGEYVYFLNAGDALHSPSVLAELHALLATSPDWAFGRVQIDGPQASVVTPMWDYAKETGTFFSRGLFPPHQGTVVRRAVLSSVGGFDTSYRIAADYAAFLRLSQVSDPLVTDLLLADFQEGGASTQHWQQSFAEFHRARTGILRPTGLAALREKADTAVHYAKVFAYREVILRARR